MERIPAAEIWDARHSLAEPHPVDRALVGTDIFWDLLGDVRGKRVLDLGCGQGDLAVLLARAGARVTAVDGSAGAIVAARRQAAFNGVRGIRFVRADAVALGTLGQFDLVTGRYILHHIEPFADFVPLLRCALAPGGRAVFIENSARNPLLMLARRHLVGRFGLPRRGDGRERPFSDRESALLRREFGRVTVVAPELVLFRLVARYFLRRHERAASLFNRLDRLCYRYFTALRRWGYLQVIAIDA
ncbi:MAG: methyltransferase domain-containing protein [Candidatus Edwardsbacteria bacterium]|jgi:SAM-dependent methyltransferase|nr:methyltransferase domain-containing protein [Candidatus Edwardsbacteria bacterium]